MKANTWPIWFGVPGRVPLRLLPNIREFRNKVPLRLERGDYLVKTIETPDELERVLQLRYSIFHREYKGKLFPVGVDWEDLDPVADHLVIVDKRSGKFVGTYRLIASPYSSRFYSQSEFQLTDFLELPGTKLELSRACVRREYRNGVVLQLLWRGLTEYFRKVGADYVFGCCSVQTMDPRGSLDYLGNAFGKGTLASTTAHPPDDRIRNGW